MTRRFGAERHDFYLYIDEFQNFITDLRDHTFEARKHCLNLIIAHQYMGQLVQNNETKIRDAVWQCRNHGGFPHRGGGCRSARQEPAPVFNARSREHRKIHRLYQTARGQHGRQAIQHEFYSASKGSAKAEVISSFRDLSTAAIAPLFRRRLWNVPSWALRRALPSRLWSGRFRNTT